MKSVVFPQLPIGVVVSVLVRLPNKLYFVCPYQVMKEFFVFFFS